MAIEVNKPNVGLSFKKVTAPKVKLGAGYKEVNGYSYEMFLSDIYDFMVDGFEETGSYFYLDAALVDEDPEVKVMLDYGVNQGILAVFEIVGSRFLYVEVVDMMTVRSLVEFYISEDYRETSDKELVELQESITNDVNDLMLRYIQSQGSFTKDLYSLVSVVPEIEVTVSFREQVQQPIGICGLSDSKMVALDGDAIPLYKISLGMALKLISITRLSVLGLTSVELKKWSDLKAGYYKLDNVTVTGDGSAIVLEGVVKNDTYK